MEAEEAAHSRLESQLLALMSRARVLALRQRLRTRAFSHVAELAHRSSTEAMEQVGLFLWFALFLFGHLENTRAMMPSCQKRLTALTSQL